jgi:hypothetical protein
MGSELCEIARIGKVGGVGNGWLSRGSFPSNALQLAQLLNCAERLISKLVETKKERLYPMPIS